jgi:N-acetylmuramoyl-L-alanine amidase
LRRFYDKGLIKTINARNAGKDTEIKFTLGNEYTTNEVLNAEGSNDILITIHNKIFARNEERQKNRLKWNFDVIVIDAGHGGKDAGAIGVNGIEEKDVNLGVALKLGELIEKEMKDVKVVYTRKNDTFVELYKRGKIANEEDGKLFISIHCNSTSRKPTNVTGFEVYLLRPGRTKEAISIAEMENSVIQYEENPERYEKLTDENFILVTMAHSAYMKYSEKFSDILNRQMSVDLPVTSRGIKQAGFYVLVGASMPSVLIETGFLSNKRDADYLKSSKGQRNIAGAIFKAIESFKEYYEKVMQTEL